MRKTAWLKRAALPLATVVAMALSAPAQAQTYRHYECDGG
ncbi:MAG: hypothetical protein QOF09_1248, partial [Alphaproteobacteria bacterium]|nr:hypothetical protein [Alphaproteobacteria bacterium]